jgi:hypothetical protein
MQPTDFQTSYSDRWRGLPCARCDRPEATAAAWDEVPEGGRTDLCWGSTDCDMNPKDWRAEALALRSRLTQLLDTVEGRVLAVLDDLPDEAARLLAAAAMDEVRKQQVSCNRVG